MRVREASLVKQLEKRSGVKLCRAEVRWDKVGFGAVTEHVLVEVARLLLCHCTAYMVVREASDIFCASAYVLFNAG